MTLSTHHEQICSSFFNHPYSSTMAPRTRKTAKLSPKTDDHPTTGDLQVPAVSLPKDGNLQVPDSPPFIDGFRRATMDGHGNIFIAPTPKEDAIMTEAPQVPNVRVIVDGEVFTSGSEEEKKGEKPSKRKRKDPDVDYFALYGMLDGNDRSLIPMRTQCSSCRCDKNTFVFFDNRGHIFKNCIACREKGISHYKKRAKSDKSSASAPKIKKRKAISLSESAAESEGASSIESREPVICVFCGNLANETYDNHPLDSI